MTLDEINAIPHTVTYVGETSVPDFGPTLVDHWHVSLPKAQHDLVPAKPVTFDYYTGLGHRARNGDPALADVLQCLTSDAEALDQTFHEWCDNFGYSNDSIKALNTYKECRANGKKLRDALGADTYKQVAEALQDY